MRVRRAKKIDRKQYGNSADVIITNDLTQTHSTVWAIPESQARELLGKLAGVLRSPHAGKSLLETLTEELDAIVDRLMADPEPIDIDQVPDDQLEAWAASVQSWGEERGRAQGVAYALAVLTNPYAPSVPAQRAAAAARWQERYAGQD
jgi:hypothetical protein